MLAVEKDGAARYTRSKEWQDGINLTPPRESSAALRGCCRLLRRGRSARDVIQKTFLWEACSSSASLKIIMVCLAKGVRKLHQSVLQIFLLLLGLATGLLALRN